MTQIKIRKPAFFNNLLFAVCLGLAWFYYIPTPHHISTSVSQVDSIIQKFQKELDISLEIKFDNTQDQSKLLPLYTEVIKKPLEEDDKKNLTGSELQKGQTSNVLLRINCLPGQSGNSLVVNSLSEFIVKGDCQELETSTKLQKEVKRVITTLTKGLNDESNLNLAAEIVHLNVYLIISTVDKGLVTPLKKRLTNTITAFSKKMGLPQKQYRLNFQTLWKEDLGLPLRPEAKGLFSLLVNELDHFIDTFPSVAKEQVYTFETEAINLFVFTDKKIYFVDEERSEFTYFDERKEKYAAVVFDVMNATTVDLMTLRVFFRLFELTTLQELSTSLSSVKLEYSHNVEFELFNRRRSQFLIQHIIKGLEAFKYVIQDTELVIAKDVGAKIDAQFEAFKSLDPHTMGLDDLQKVHQMIWTLNYDGNHKYGYRDSFSDDYRIGIYLPLLLPFLYPVLKTLANYRKKRRL